MFKKNGRKIKSWAETLMYVTIVVGALAILISFGACFINNSGSFGDKFVVTFGTLIITIAGVLALILCFRLLYGYGELIVKTSEIASILQAQEERYQKEHAAKEQNKKIDDQ